MKESGPQPINRVIRQREDQIAPEAIGSVSEEEFLGLDRPQFELLSRGQSLIVPKVVYYISQRGGNLDVQRALLQRHGLDEGVYDEVENKRGLFSTSPHQERAVITVIRASNLRLSGVRSELLNQFFSIQQQSLVKYFSPAFYVAVERSDHLRETYPLRHREQFPLVDSLLGDIEAQTGLAPEAIFNAGHIPTSFEHQARQSSPASRNRAQPRMITEYLQMIREALSGDKSMSDIAAIHDRTYPTIRNIFYGDSKILSDQMRKVIQSRLNAS